MDADSDRLKMQAPLLVTGKTGEKSLIAFPRRDFTDFSLTGDARKTLKFNVDETLSYRRFTDFS